MTVLINIAVFVAVVAVQTAVVVWHAKRPYDVAHEDITITINPRTNSYRINGPHTKQQYDEIVAWVHDEWEAIYKSHHGWRILVRPF